MIKHLLEYKMWCDDDPILRTACGVKMLAGKEAKDRITVNLRDVTCKRCQRTYDYQAYEVKVENWVH